MTYVTLEIFAKCLQIGKVQDRSEYRELWDKGIVPRKIMPRDPSRAYAVAPDAIKRDVMNFRGEWKNGVFRQFTKAEQQSKRKAYQKSKRFKAIVTKAQKRYASTVKSKTTRKKYNSTGKAREARRLQQLKNRIKLNAYQVKYRAQPKAAAKIKLYQNRPEVKARKLQLERERNKRKRV